MEKSFYSMLENGELRDILTSTALEINMYSEQKELHSNKFSKLSKILYEIISPDKILKGKRQIDNYIFVGEYFKEALELNQKENPKTEYKSKKEIVKMIDISEEIVPIIFKISEDLKDLSKEKMQDLTTLCINFSKYASSYYRNPIRKMAI